MEYEVIIARSALRDLEQIRAHIARDNLVAAQAFALKLLDEAQSLSAFPAEVHLCQNPPLIINDLRNEL